MEILEYLGSAFLFVAIVMVALQLLMSYSLQALADKNELPDFARFLAWIPLANLYPLIAVSGLSFKKFVLGFAGAIGAMIAAGILGGVLGEGVGAIVGAGLMFLVAIGMLYYVGLVMWKTAERRGIAGFIGLLTLVPFFGMFAYAYIAFHDGWAPLNKAGFAIGLVLAVGPMVGQYQMMQSMGEQLAQMEMNEELMGEATLTINGETIEMGQMGGEMPTLGQAMDSMGAVVELGAKLAMAESLDPRDPAQAEQIGSLIVESKRRLAEVESQLQPEQTASLQDAIAQMENRLQQGLGIDPSNAAAPPTADGLTGEAGAAMESDVVWAVEGEALVPVTANAAFDAEHGFEVPMNVACPAGTLVKGGQPPEAFKQWCEHTGEHAGLKHGWYTEWHETGVRRVAGEYHDGMPIGVWTRWFEDGIKRAQAEFEAGLQDGRLMAWDRTGRKVRELRFQQGEVASR